MRKAVAGWVAFGVLVVFALAMLTHLRMRPVPLDVRCIADALETISLRDHGPQVEMNEAREFTE